MKVMEFEETCSEVKVRNFSIVAMWYMISSMCFHKNEVMEYMEKVYEELGMTSYAMWFQKNADVFPKQKKQNIVEYETIHSNETVAFIIAVNDELIFQEAVYYIEHLHMPNGMKKEIIPVRGATSMANAYNEGMRRSKAKYKVYMHQDVLLVYKELLYEMLDIFQDEKIGMIGVAGTTHMPSNGIWWESEERNVYMKVYQDNIVKYGYSVNNEFNEKYKRVKYLDGLLLITQYDIPWREDLFDNWHFYDISQCCEMECFNYQVVVARQNEVWCLHEQKWNKDIAEEYYKAREKFMEKYKSFI